MAIDVDYVKQVISKIKTDKTKLDNIDIQDLNSLEKVVKNIEEDFRFIEGTQYDSHFRGLAHGLKEKLKTHEEEMVIMYAELSLKYPVAFNGSAYKGPINGSNGKS